MMRQKERIAQAQAFLIPVRNGIEPDSDRLAESARALAKSMLARPLPVDVFQANGQLSLPHLDW
jgi:hypothetical protein